MRRIVVLVVLLTLLPLRAFADPAPVVPVPPGDDRIEVVKKGDPAPFTGQLFDQATALRWANFLQQYKLRLTLDLELQRKMMQADIDYQKKLVTIGEEKYDRSVGALEAENKALKLELASPPFYKTTWFGVVVGAVAMGSAVALAAWGLSATK